LSAVIFGELALVAIRHNTPESYAPTPAASPRWPQSGAAAFLLHLSAKGGQSLPLAAVQKSNCRVQKRAPHKRLKSGAPRWSAFAEYNFMGSGTQSMTFTGCGGTCVVSANAKADVQNVLAGVNYKFNF
jgi:hypothetical protein